MTIKSILALSAIALASVAAQATTAPVNLIQNGSFEANVLEAGTWEILYGNKLIDWKAGPNGAELRDAVAGKAQDGVNFVELDTTKNSWMSQKVNIATAGTYQLSFWYNSRPDNGNRPADTDKISWSFGEADGVVMKNYTKDNSDTWSQFTETFNFSADTNLTLKFSGSGKSDSYGGSLDNVSLTKITLEPNITPVPEPESYAMLIAGLGLMATIARRRNQRKA
jgi:hypothetical protein